MEVWERFQKDQEIIGEALDEATPKAAALKAVQMMDDDTSLELVEALIADLREKWDDAQEDEEDEDTE